MFNKSVILTCNIFIYDNFIISCNGNVNNRVEAQNVIESHKKALEIFDKLLNSKNYDNRLLPKDISFNSGDGNRNVKVEVNAYIRSILDIDEINHVSIH